MRPKLKVDCYKKSGKWAYSNMTENDEYPIVDRQLYPTLIDPFGKAPSRKELWDMQSEATYELGELIRNNDRKVTHLSPEEFGFDKEYIYVIELLLPGHYQGFCQFIMDNTK